MSLTEDLEDAESQKEESAKEMWPKEISEYPSQQLESSTLAQPLEQQE